MSQIIILHGTGCTPTHYWYPWIKEQCERRGDTVHIPDLPNRDHPDIEVWSRFVLDNYTLSTDTVLIGHSAGCPLILGLLERAPTKIKQAILVAGFASSIGGSSQILQKSYDWEKIKHNCAAFVFFNSTNDPWGCDEKKGQEMVQHLGGTLIIKEDGHFGSNSFNQPYKEFPALLHRIL